MVYETHFNEGVVHFMKYRVCPLASGVLDEPKLPAHVPAKDGKFHQFGIPGSVQRRLSSVIAKAISGFDRCHFTQYCYFAS